jgi:ribosomal-protein-serine acetyltransferase
MIAAVFTYPIGSGVVMAPLEPWCAEQFFEHLVQVREHIASSAPFANYVFDVDGARTFLQRFADGHADDSMHLFGLWHNGKVIGGVMLIDFDANTGNCAIGVWIAPEFQGLGLISKAARSVIDWAIMARGMSRVQWSTNPANERSIAVARRLGLTKEGTLRSSFVINGIRSDQEIWSAIAESWPATSPG